MRKTATAMITSRKTVPGYTVLIDFLAELTTISFNLSSGYGLMVLSIPAFQVSLMSFVSITFTF
ncbi:hypothetical protein M134_0043 [Bacteroides fragilis str. S24L34]|nr:hypothetical protein M134_0043 [Bacteroides fragilis str. S24L34]